MDIKQFLAQLSTFNKIDFSGKETEFSLLAQKYDKNKNSIFEADELRSLSKDLQHYAEKDNNADDLSKREAKTFFKTLLPEGINLREYVDKAGKNIEDLVTDLFQGLNILGIENDKEGFIRNKIKEIGDKRTFDEDFVQMLSKLDAEHLAKVSELFYVEGRQDDEQFDEYFLSRNLGQYNDKQLSRVFELVYIANRDEQLQSYDIAALVNLSDEEFERARSLLYIKKRKKQFGSEDIERLVKLPKEEFRRAQNFFFVQEREEQFSGMEICELSKLKGKELLRAKKMFNIKERKTQLNGMEIAQLARLDDNDFKKVQELLYIAERNGEDFDARSIMALIKLPKEQYDKAKEFFYIPQRKAQFDGYDISYLVKLSGDELKRAEEFFNVDGRLITGKEITQLLQLTDNQLQRARELFHVEERKIPFDIESIIELAKLSDDEFKRAQRMFGIEGKVILYSGSNIAKLATLKEEDADWAIEFLCNSSFEIDEILKMAKNHNKHIEDLLNAQEVFKVQYTSDDTLKILVLSDKKYYTYDKENLIETGEIENIDNTDVMKKCTKTTYMNTNSNIKQEIYKGRLKETSETIEIVYKEVLTYFDKEGNIIKTVTMVRNPQNGFLSVSETDKNGEVIPIQSQIYDPNTGAEITERCLTSPEGITTDYYAEISDNLKIINYKILDNDGKLLIDIMQTFEKISDNKYISSINTTGNTEDTQIYEMEYTDNNRIIIFDKNNNKTTEIDLKKYFADEQSMEKLLPAIKQLPGQILLKFAEKPPKISYIDGDILSSEYSYTDARVCLYGDGGTLCDEENTFAVLLHELGHYLDVDKTNISKIANRPEIVSIFKEEFEEFRKHATTAQQEYINYFTNIQSDIRGNEERVAETHSLLYANNQPELSTRRLYFAQYFPRTITAIMKLLLEEEGVVVK